MSTKDAEFDCLIQRIRESPIESKVIRELLKEDKSLMEDLIESLRELRQIRLEDKKALLPMLRKVRRDWDADSVEVKGWEDKIYYLNENLKRYRTMQRSYEARLAKLKQMEY